VEEIQFMSNKATKLIVLGLLLALTAVFTTGVYAQDCPSGLGDADCTLVTTALSNLEAAESVAVTFDTVLNADLGFFATVVTISGGNGVLLLDGNGVITAAHLEIPTLNYDMSFMAINGAMSLIYVDNFLYFGRGDSLDELTWRGIAAEEVGNSTFTIGALASLDSVGGDTADIDLGSVSAEWSRDDNATLADGRSVVAITGVYNNVNPLDAIPEDAEEVTGNSFDLVEGMTGVLNGTYTISIDPSNETIAGILALIDMTYSFDMSGMGDMLSGLGDLDTEGLDELGELGDLGAIGDELGDIDLDAMFGSMFSDTNFAINAEISITFDGVNEAYSVTAPESFEPVSDSAASNLRFSNTESLFDLATNYFIENVDESSFGGDFNFGSDFNFDFSSSYYGNCAIGSRDNTPAGPISVGQTVSGNLAEGAADLWAFTANAGDVVTISLSSDDFDGYLELVGPSGGLVSDDDGGGYPNPLIDGFELTEAGEYSIVACGWSSFASGEYSVTLGN
jgi:hypothetical protein